MERDTVVAATAQTLKKIRNETDNNGELDITICFCNKNRINEFAHLSIGILWDEIKKYKKTPETYSMLQN